MEPSLGCSGPQIRARSEISENLPRLARLMLLQSLWREPIGGCASPGALDQLPAAQRLLTAG
jgi:hypothetical protein